MKTELIEIYRKAKLRRIAAVAMRDCGVTYREIGKVLGGVSIERARQLVFKGRREKTHNEN